MSHLRAQRAAALLYLLLSGCTVGPHYTKPDTPVAAQYHSTDALNAVASQTAPALDEWWRGFDDPALTRVVGKVLEQNLDLQAAQARVGQARAAAGESRTAWLPQASLDGSIARERQSTLSPLGSIASQFPGYSRNQTLQQLGAGASWELDLAGGLHRQAEALRAEAEAAEAAHMGTRISVVAEAADAYFQVRRAQASLALLQTQVETDRDYLNVVDDRIREGVAIDRDRDDAEALLAQDQASLPIARAQLQRQLNRLDVLMGDAPGVDAASIQSDASYTWTSPGIPGSVRPAQLLRRRPDVIAAERRLAAATASVGVALAQYYPDVSLSGLLGFERLGNGSLFTDRAFQPAVLSGIHWRLFDFGRVDAEVAQARGARTEALSQYRQVLLRATEDAENALVTLAQADARTREWQAALNANDQAGQSTQRSYEAGTASMVDVLRRKRSLLEVRRAWVLASSDQTRATVDAYRALGGGWSPDSPVQAQR